ncbi:MAG: molybdopterin biosynthesis protein [Rhodobacteraceae bacterium]|nr:molybdopterin biosynthesis protein [Paracoccaceae bacterium]
MDFGPVPLTEAEGAILAHSRMLGGRKLSKGHQLTATDIAALAAEGVARLIVARPAPGDLGEDAAAERLAAALVPDEAAAGLSRTTAFTGRVNLKATGPGLVDLDPAAILALNRIDPAITLATLAPLTRVAKGTLVGTVKIIAYAVDAASLAAAEDAARDALRIHPVQCRSAGLLLTEVPGQAAKLNAKAREVTARRLRALGMDLAGVVSVAHEADAIAAALPALPGDIVLILTGSATSDLHDTGPEGVRAAGGSVARFGMPVDPGNLLFLGQLGARPVIGLPGCARSPALNGADWVLERLACGIEVTGDDLAMMGVGGLLKEIPIRPQPREREA